MEALLRRAEFGRRDDLRVATRPRGGSPFGVYRTQRGPGPRGRRKSAQRPYTTLLESIEPLVANCDCRDFARSSLGICKHVLCILEDLAGRPRMWRRAISAAPSASPPSTGLVWNPKRPLTSAGDWLERVSLRLPENGLSEEKYGRTLRWFRKGADAELALRSAHGEDPIRRLELVEALIPLARRKGRNGVDNPAIRVLLEEEGRRLRDAATLRLSSGGVSRALKGIKRSLYPYQREGVASFFRSGRLLLADDMGLGKTLQATAVCHALWRLGKVKRGLIIVPASLKFQWLREWSLASRTPIESIDGAPADRRATLRKTREGFLVANYEQVLRDLPAMQAWKPEIVVLDEAQRIKNWAAKTSACVKKLTPPYRLVLSGTPMENRLEELASIMDWVDDLALEPKWRLVPAHTIRQDGSKEVTGARNLDTLRERLRGRMLRRVRQDVLDQLPPRTDTPVVCECTEEQREAHEELVLPIARLLSITHKRPLTQAEFLRLMSLLTTQRIIANGIAQLDFETVWPRIEGVTDPDEALVRSLAAPKLLEVREILRQVVLEQRRKVVVFSQWVRMLRLAHWAIAGILGSAGLRAAFFTGREKAKRRTQNVAEFHDDPTLRVLFATDAGGVGLNLQKAATCCVNLELPWNPAVLEQRIGRIYRLGQTKPIDVYNLMTRETIEERIAALVSDKKALFRGLFDGTTDEVRFEGSTGFLSALERVIDPPLKGSELEDEEEPDDSRSEHVDELIAAADEGDERPVRDEPPRPAQARSGEPRADLSQLFSGLEVRRTDTGGLTIEAAPEAAEALASAFEGLAKLLRAQADLRRG
ncbi:MAG: DEAD/DEAH box helicase [Deltaproteobacteria bacterium]|nr:DEAD/DEAH box helicase [Deltaproteobacteria bacterium]